jgi:hypothetical protein
MGQAAFYTTKNQPVPRLIQLAIERHKKEKKLRTDYTQV